MTIQKRIEELGYTLPTPPTPVANYVPAIIVGSELRTSGQIPIVDGELRYKGSVPGEQPIGNAIEATRICGLNAIAVAGNALGGNLEQLDGVLQIRVFVASDIGFDGHSTVANGVSDLMVDIFGESGRHIRVAMGSIGLPLGATTEVEIVFKLKNRD